MSEPSALPPFVDMEHECQKCRGDDISFTHHANGYHSRYRCALVDLLRTSFPPEHLCLRCRRCGHSWAMATADTPRSEVSASGGQPEAMPLPHGLRAKP